MKEMKYRSELFALEIMSLKHIEKSQELTQM